MGTWTPWGTAQSSKSYGPGITSYSTAGHGGFKVAKAQNAAIHPALRSKDGWYEEDCEWAAVVLSYPALFDASKLASAHASLKTWNPDGYTAATGTPVKLGESHVLRRRAAQAAAGNKYVVVSASGDWHKDVPAGFVGGHAVRGGRLENGRYASTDEKVFLIPAEEYEKAPELFDFGFVVEDETKYATIAKL